MPLPVHPDVEGLGERGRPPVHDKVPNALASPRVRLQVRQHPRLRHHDVQLVALAQRLRRRLDARPRLPVQRAVRLGGADLRGRVRTRRRSRRGRERLQRRALAPMRHRGAATDYRGGAAPATGGRSCSCSRGVRRRRGSAIAIRHLAIGRTAGARWRALWSELVCWQDCAAPLPRREGRRED